MASTQNLDAILAELTARKTAAAKKAEDDMGSKDTSHPSAKVDNGTQTSNLEGARSAENTSDTKAQNALNPDSAGSPEVKAPAGSLGVDAKASDEAPADKPDTSGKSEMGAKDTTHPSKSAAALKLLDDAIKLAEEGKLPAEIEKAAAELEKQAGETEKSAVEKQAAEFAQYCDSLVKQHPEDFQAGYKFAADVLGLMLEAKTAAEGMPMEAAGAAPLAGAETPAEESAEAAMAAPGAELGEEDQLAALEQALAEAGVTPEELAAAIQAESEGGAAGAAPGAEAAAPAETVPAEAAAKVAAEKAAKIAALKDALVADLKALKGKK